MTNSASADQPQEVFPIVVGCGRSGTTLLRTILASHPLLAVSLGKHPLDLWRVRQRYVREGGFDLARFADDLLSIQQFRVLGIDPSRLRQELTGVRPIHYGEAWRRVFRLYAESKGKPRYGHKNPGFVLALETVASWWPEARFIHLYRDGRNVALSLMQQGWGPKNVASAARWWGRHVASGSQSGLALGPGRYMEVRYEDLVEDPEPTVRQIAGFAGLEYDPQMLAYQAKAMDDIPERFRHPHRHLIEPPTNGIRDWPRDMATRDVAVFEAVAGAELSALGYERRYPTVPPWARLQARGQIAYASARRRLKPRGSIRRAARGRGMRRKRTQDGSATTAASPASGT